MSVVNLNRRFHEWNEEEPPDPEMHRIWGLNDGGVGWAELIHKRRAVILAEAGSGKSIEFAERARLTRQTQPYVFHASVEDVGCDGLDYALSVPARRELGEWRQGTDDAWFFIDSVDEAKVAGVKFERVVRKLAEGVHGAEERCHIFLSGRVTDWEPRRDLEALKKWLPISCLISKPAPTPKEELLRIIRNELKPKEKAPPEETPFVAIMAQLDRHRIRLFAEAAGAAQSERFLMAIDDSNLWHFARRPLDLDWLVRFWQTESRLGTLQEMVERSIVERLKETNPDRARIDDLNNVNAVCAVERIGAAMVFGRQTTIAIPDGEAEMVSDIPLDLADILPDWSGDDRSRLLTRPIFDPATRGRARFHNDNDGTVRSYLAARWLIRLREANLTTAGLLRLLFANSYGLEVTKPSLNETTAWLCLWDKDVASEVVRLSPGLLLSAGDPASLQSNIRCAALVALLRELTAENPEWPWWDNDKLRRFAQSDLGGAVHSLWPKYRENQEASQLLMRLIWLGRLKECEQLAREVAFDNSEDPTVRVFSGNALLAMADQSTRIDYATLIKTQAAILPLRMVRDAVVAMFPTAITPTDVLLIFAEVNIEDDRNEFGLTRECAALAEKLESAADLDLFLTGLLGLLGTQLGDHARHPPTKREEIFFSAMAEAALRLLKAVPSNNAPDAAIDALLRICNRDERGSSMRTRAAEALVELHLTSERRRRAFWRVVSSLRTASQTLAIDQFWQIEFLGYPAGLKSEDVTWLMADGLAQGGADCKLAVNTALTVYRSQGEPASLFSQIAAAVEADPISQKAFLEWTAPRTPSESELKFERQRREIESQNRAQSDERDQFWIEFIQNLRSDPDMIEKLRQPASEEQPSELMNLWRLLNGASNHSRRGINSVAPLERIAGAEVAKAAEAGLIAHWRAHKPLLRSQRGPQERNSVRYFDLMGLTGVTLEATQGPAWAAKLSGKEARRATEFATFEINGFPPWLADLVASDPVGVSTVLHREIKDELMREGVTFFETLHAVAVGGDHLALLLAPLLLQDLEAGLIPPRGALSLVLQIIINGLTEPARPRFEQWAVGRFEQEPDVEAAVQHLSAVFSINPRGATSVFVAKATAVDEEAQTVLVDRFLTACFGDLASATTFKAVTSTPADIIEELMLLSLKTRKRVATRQRPAGVVYTFGDSDYADQARSTIFGRFVQTPGSATYHALRRLQEDPTFPVPPARLRALAEQRAIEDSETAPWPPGEAYAFEKSRETAPRTGKDLISVLLGRIDDMQHELLHDDFSQALTLKGIGPKEREIQKWIADRLRLKQGRSFSVEREPHVVDEKEPDVRIRAKATDANVSVEIKVAESWSLTDLDNALEVQLCGRYLRSNQGRYGVLLIVHQEARPVGWEDKAVGKYLSFPQVVDRLRARALAISGQSHDSPQPQVAVLDVSGS